MGTGPSRPNVTTQSRDITNRVLTEAQSTCTSSCASTTSDTEIHINGTIHTGNSEFEKICVTQSSCPISQQINDNVNLILTGMSKNRFKADQGPFTYGFVLDDTTDMAKQNVVNGLTQVLETSCSAPKELLTDPKTVTVTAVNHTNDGGFQGNAYLTNDGNDNAVCVHNNLAKITAYNQNQGISTNNNNDSNLSTLVILIVTFAILILLILLLLSVGLGDPEKKGVIIHNTGAVVTTQSSVSSLPAIFQPAANIASTIGFNSQVAQAEQFATAHPVIAQGAAFAVANPELFA